MHKKMMGAALAIVMASAALSPVAMAASRYEILQEGDKDGSVYTLQEYLADKGLLNVDPTGYYGSLTEQAVISFQESAGLSTDGKAGPATLSKLLGSAYDGVTYSGSLKEDVLQNGDESLAVGDVQRRLMELGYIELSEFTSYFGSITEDGVRRFQRANKLNVDGIAGPATLKRMFSSSATAYTMYPDDTGNDVTRLQKRLAELNYFKQDATGFYGPYTTEAVIAFQKRNDLSADGIAGPRTLDKLYSPDAKSAAKASSSTDSKKTEQTEEKKTEEKKEPASSGSDVDSVIKLAKSKLGCKYVWSTEGPNTFDCSGFVYYTLKSSGVSVSRLNAAGFSQVSSWAKVSSIGNLQKGDLVFFRSPSSSRVSHTGIYIGGGEFIHAASGKGKVVISDINSNYYKSNFVVGRRPNY